MTGHMTQMSMSMTRTVGTQHYEWIFDADEHDSCIYGTLRGQSWGRGSL